MDYSDSTRTKKNKKQEPLEPKYLVSIKDDRNNCYDNISVNIDRGMPGHPLEHEIKHQETRELAEQSEDKAEYEIYLQEFSTLVPHENPYEPIFLIPIKEDRNNCYDNISANIDRGMPGHPLEHEIKLQKELELLEQEEDKEDYELFLQEGPLSSSQQQINRRRGPLQPKYLLSIKENRNNCYDNIAANIDRGMPGHPLEKEMEDQEKRDSYEQAEDKEDYEFDLQQNSPNKRRRRGPLQPKYLVKIKENRNNCYDNIAASIDRGMPGHPLEKEMEDQEKRDSYEQAEDKEDYEFDLQQNSSSPNRKRRRKPLEPKYLIKIKENRNNCYDNIAASIDRGMPGHPLEKEMEDQERLEKLENQADTKLSQSESSSSSSSSSEEEHKKPKPPPKEEGVFMQLEVNEDESFSSSSSSDDSEKRKRVRPPSSRPHVSSPRANNKKPFFSSYDPKIFYPSPDPKRGASQRIFRNKVKHPVRLKVTLKDIGLDGMDSPIPNRASELFNKEKMKQKANNKPERTLIIPNQTDFSKSFNYSQFKSTQNQELSHSMNGNQKGRLLDYESSDSYEYHNFDLDEIDNSSSSSSAPSPPSAPPSPNDDEVKINKIERKPFALKISEPQKKKPVDGTKSPRRKKETTTRTSTYDPSIFYEQPSSNSSNETGPRVRYVNDLIRKPIKLTVTLKEIGLEGLDQPVPSRIQNHLKQKSEK